MSDTLLKCTTRHVRLFTAKVENEDLVLDSGHFISRERPIDTTNAMMWFFNSMLGSGLKIFRRSKELGLPTKPTKALKNKFGVNSVKFEKK